MYYKKVDKRSRKALVDFLKKHFRYHTMNSWNRSTSYANCIKLHHVDKPSGIDEDIWWQMLEVAYWHDIFNDLLENFARQYDFAWQAGINGRSGGYVVLYRGGRGRSTSTSLAPRMRMSGLSPGTIGAVFRLAGVRLSGRFSGVLAGAASPPPAGTAMAVPHLHMTFLPARSSRRL